MWGYIILIAIGAYLVGRAMGRKKGYDMGFEVGRVFGKTQARSIIVMKDSRVEPWPKATLKETTKRGRPAGSKNKVAKKTSKK